MLALPSKTSARGGKARRNWSYPIRSGKSSERSHVNNQKKSGYAEKKKKRGGSGQTSNNGASCLIGGEGGLVQKKAEVSYLEKKDLLVQLWGDTSGKEEGKSSMSGE